MDKINTHCRACSAALSNFFDFGKTTVAHHLEQVHEKSCIFCDIRISKCSNCALIQLLDSPPQETFYSNYRVLSSWKKDPHMSDCAVRLKGLLGGNVNAKILELGCNDGLFLDHLRNIGFESVIGCEPARDAYESAISRGLKIENSYFNNLTVNNLIEKYGKFDAIVARQVLEHISDIPSFFNGMKAIANEGCAFLIDVPDFEFSMKWNDYSALWEEHVNLFTETSISKIASDYNFVVKDLKKYDFCGQTISICGMIHSDRENASEQVHIDSESHDDILFQNYVSRFPKLKSQVASWISETIKDKKLVLYGAGNRSNTFVNLFSISKYISHWCDDQKGKIGFYMPGSDLKIHSSSILLDTCPSVCLLGVNAENEHAIIAAHSEYLSKGGIFYSINPPSEFLLPALCT